MTLLVLASTPAKAESYVLLYGMLDAGLAYIDNGGGAHSFSQTSGLDGPNFFGFKGREDLGGGLAAIFDLQSSFAINTGAASSYSGNYSSATPAAPNGLPGTGFDRRAIVGLNSNTFGTLVVGRDFSPSYYAWVKADIFQLQSLGNANTVIGLGGVEHFGRVSNAVFYISPNLYGLTVHLTYSLGDQSPGGIGNPPTNAGRLFGVSGVFEKQNLTLAASYQRATFANIAGSPPAFTGSTSDRWDYLFGGRYKFGIFEASGGYWKEGTPVSAWDAWLGAGVQIGIDTLQVQVQRLAQDNPTGEVGRGTVFGISYKHPLSKSTFVYADYGRVWNNSTGNFSLFGGAIAIAPSTVGADPNAFGIGIRHFF
ncbi:porin [Paraburkholderia sp. MM5477-R1]|uniref:porin n=1 Tax=Paraburkholderia sp. MM5477-R1 TaxID=2991062 RepID=UPI003D243EF3